MCVQIARPWDNGGNTGAYVITLNLAGMADFDTGDIGDRVQRTRRENTDYQARVPGARPFFRAGNG